MLSIDKPKFLELYKGKKIVDNIDLFYSKPKNNDDLVKNYLISKLWRLNNLYTIIDKYGNKVRFVMNLSQHRVYAAKLHHPRLIILKSRQQGISTFWLIDFFDDLCFRKNLSIGLMAQGQDEASTLLERVKLLWDEFPLSTKQLLGLSVVEDNTKRLSLSTGSKIFVRTSFRSTTLQRLHISEMGKIANNYPKKAKETKTGTLQTIAAGNPVVIESTAEGDNMFKTDWEKAVTNVNALSPKDFYPVFLSWLDDPTCVESMPQVIDDKTAKYFEKIELELNRVISLEQKNFWVMQYRELGDEIYQEYPSTEEEAFMVNRAGAYYAHKYLTQVVKQKRIVYDLYDKNLDVQIAADLGMDDTMVITVFQDYNDSTRIIDEVYGNGEDIKYYCDELKEKEYYPQLNHIILPHDAEVKELTSGLTRKEAFENEIPQAYITVLAKVSVQDGINAVRDLLSRLWIDAKCTYIMKCLMNYTKEWDDKRQVWKNKPLHDESSNGADSIRYLALGRLTTVLGRKTGQKRPRGYDV